MLGIVFLFTNTFVRHKEINPHPTVKKSDNRKIWQ